MNNRLGKGIEALIKTRELSQEGYLDGFIDINKIKINPDQPRKYFDKESLDSLVESIKEKGILQPITVKSLDDNFFELVAGERRVRAAKTLNLKTIPGYIIQVKSDLEKLELALIENIQRNDLNVIEEAEAYSILSEKYDLTHEQIGKRVGKSRVEITRTIDLMNLPNNIKKSLIENSNNSNFSFSRGHARIVLSLKDSMEIQNLYNRILKEKLSVRQTEQLVKKNNKPNKQKTKPDITVNKAEKLLSSLLEAKVEIQNKKNNSGHIKVLFKNKDDRARIIRMIKSLKK